MTGAVISRQGQGAVPDSLLNAFVQSTTLATDLVNTPGVSGMNVWVTGTRAVADGGQGFYNWQPGATGPTSLPAVIAPVGSTGAWVFIPYPQSGGGGGTFPGAGNVIYATLPTGPTDNWAPTGYNAATTAIGITTGQRSAQNLDGGVLVGLTGGVSGRMLTLFNAGGSTLLIYGLSSGTAANTFNTPGGTYSQSQGNSPFAPFVIPASFGVTFIYDATDAVWTPLAAPNAPNMISAPIPSGTTSAWQPDNFDSTVDAIQVVTAAGAATLNSIFANDVTQFYGNWQNRSLTLLNNDANNLTIKNAIAASIVDFGRFILPGASDLVIPPRGGAGFRYWQEGATQGWYLTSAP